MKTPQITYDYKNPPMNTRKIKLALTAGLINKNKGNNALASVKDLMAQFADDAGRFIELTSLSNRTMGSTVKERYALQYEKCILNVDLVSYPKANHQMVQAFQVR